MSKIEIVNDSQYIIEAVKNASKNEYSDLIVFTFYDVQGNQIRSASDIVNNMKAGNTWRFKTSMIDNNVARHELDEIRYN